MKITVERKQSWIQITHDYPSEAEAIIDLLKAIKRLEEKTGFQAKLQEDL